MIISLHNVVSGDTGEICYGDEISYNDVTKDWAEIPIETKGEICEILIRLQELLESSMR